MLLCVILFACKVLAIILVIWLRNSGYYVLDSIKKCSKRMDKCKWICKSAKDETFELENVKKTLEKSILNFVSQSSNGKETIGISGQGDQKSIGSNRIGSAPIHCGNQITREQIPFSRFSTNLTQNTVNYNDLGGFNKAISDSLLFLALREIEKNNAEEDENEEALKAMTIRFNRFCGFGFFLAHVILVIIIIIMYYV